MYIGFYVNKVSIESVSGNLQKIAPSAGYIKLFLMWVPKHWGHLRDVCARFSYKGSDYPTLYEQKQTCGETLALWAITKCILFQMT